MNNINIVDLSAFEAICTISQAWQISGFLLTNCGS